MSSEEPFEANEAPPQQSKRSYFRGAKGCFYFFIILLIGAIVGWMFGVIEYLMLIHIGLAAGAAMLGILD